MSAIRTLRFLNRDVLSRRWVSVLLPLMVCLLTFAIVSTGTVAPLPMGLAIVATAVDAALLIATVFAWSHHAPFIHRLIYGKPRPVMSDDERLDLLANLLKDPNLVNTELAEAEARQPDDPGATQPIEALQSDEIDVGGEQIE